MINKFFDWCFSYNTKYVENKPEKFSDMIKIIGIVLYHMAFIIVGLLAFVLFYFRNKSQGK